MSPFAIETHGDLQPFLQQEWLLTNGLGGFACGTILSCATRRYHGLLCAATLPPVGRMMLLNRIGEIIYLDGKTDRMLELSINQFAEQMHPRGDRFLRKFQLDEHLVRWEYEIEGARIVKELQMPWRSNAMGLRYAIDPGPHEKVELDLLPFVSLRDFHSLRRGQTKFRESGGNWGISIADGPLTVYLASDLAGFFSKPDWWFGHKYPIETERGLDDTEDLYNPGRFVFTATNKATVTLWAALDGPPNFDWDAELRRRRTSAPKESAPDKDRLARVANDFVVYRRTPDGKDGCTVIAGYPWFSDWGRDAMISLPGLLLTTRRFDEARQVLCLFGQYVSEGMIPNRFDDYTSEPSYNTVDASLWFIHACHEYARTSGDAGAFEAKLKPACRAILEGYKKGTRFNIRMDESDGLINQGDATTQLTWMDAKCDGVCFTPRQGKPVEINALWYHALKLMGEEALAAKVAESFRKLFWISPYRGLADVVDGTRRDASLRPNQIFAVSLANSPLSEEQQAAVVEAVRRELLTPMGLWTLSPKDERYRGRYTGPQRQRDEAYHNGTIWPWLMGPFLEAYIKVNKRSTEAMEQARAWLAGLTEQMNRACIGQIGEIYEGDEPHRAVGCFAQAWSVAEATRLAGMLEVKGGDGKAPK